MQRGTLIAIGVLVLVGLAANGVWVAWDAWSTVADVRDLLEREQLAGTGWQRHNWVARGDNPPLAVAGTGLLVVGLVVSAIYGLVRGLSDLAGSKNPG